MTPDAAPDATPQTMDFGGLTITFDERVLRPRPWTAAQSVWATEQLPALPPGAVLELCSGAGHIGLLAVRDSGRRLVCVDLNPVATAYTRSNAEAAGLAAQVEVREGHIRDVLRPGEQFPLIIADPPWVPHEEVDRFPEDPLSAIDGGQDGMSVVRECLEAIDTHLMPGGCRPPPAGHDSPGRRGADSSCRVVEPDGHRSAGVRRPRGARQCLVTVPRWRWRWRWRCRS